jgi:hypothetical protein
MIAYFYWNLLKARILRNLLIISIVPFSALCLFDLIKFGNSQFKHLPTLVEFAFFILVIICYLFERMRYYFHTPIYNTINFWISVGLFIYFSGNFFYVLLAQTSTSQSTDIKNDLVMISGTVTLLKNFVLGFALTVKEPNESPDEYEFKIPLEINLDSFTPGNYLN